jgi:hypothetical protein
MTEEAGTGRGETRVEFDRSESEVTAPITTPSGEDGVYEGEPFRSSRLRNMTGREVQLFYRSGEGKEELRRIEPDPIRIRVRFNRVFQTNSEECVYDSLDPSLRIPVLGSKPRPGLLQICEEIVGLPAPDGGVRIIVDPAVVFALARLRTFRRDLVTLGWARRDPITHRLIGHENLTRIDFDDAPESLDVGRLPVNETARSPSPEKPEGRDRYRLGDAAGPERAAEREIRIEQTCHNCGRWLTPTNWAPAWWCGGEKDNHFCRSCHSEYTAHHRSGSRPPWVSKPAWSFPDVRASTTVSETHEPVERSIPIEACIWKHSTVARARHSRRFGDR